MNAVAVLENEEVKTDLKSRVERVILIESIKKDLEGMSNIEQITEDTIYDLYSQVIQEEHTASFKDFTQNNRDAYIRLKFKAISSQRPKFPNFPQNQDLDLIDLGIPDTNKENNFQQVLRGMEQKLTYVTIKHETLIGSIDH